MEGTPAAINTTDDLSVALRDICNTLSLKWEGGFIDTPLGRHGVTLGVDEVDDEFASIGMVLPEGVYAEIEDGTYGQLQAFRIYREDLQ